MFVTVFTATLVRIVCGGIYRHFTTFYFAFAAAFTASLVYIFSGTLYRHFSQFYSFFAAVFTVALASCITNRSHDVSYNSITVNPDDRTAGKTVLIFNIRTSTLYPSHPQITSAIFKRRSRLETR